MDANSPFNAGSTIILVKGLSSASQMTWHSVPSPAETTQMDKLNFTGVGASVTKADCLRVVARMGCFGQVNRHAACDLELAARAVVLKVGHRPFLQKRANGREICEVRAHRVWGSLQGHFGGFDACHVAMRCSLQATGSEDHAANKLDWSSVTYPSETACSIMVG